MTDLILGAVVVDVIAPDVPTFVIDPPSYDDTVVVVPLPGPPGANGDSAPADVDPILLFENALAGHD